MINGETYSQLVRQIAVRDEEIRRLKKVIQNLKASEYRLRHCA